MSKTRVTVELLADLDCYPLRVLIACPKAVVPVWKNEVEKWWVGGDAPAPAVLLIGTGPTKKRAEALRGAVENAAPLIAVVNYDAAIKGTLRAALEAIDWDVVVCDESHRLQSPSGVTSRLFAKLGARAEYRLALTGTPMPTSLLNIYGQARFLDPTCYGTSYVAFKRRYTRPAYTTADYQRADGLWLTDRGGSPVRHVPDNQEHFERVLSTFCLRVGPEALNLPPTVEETRYVELEPKARRFYRELESDLIAWVAGQEQDGVPVTAANAMVKVLRLAEVTGGAVHDESGKVVQVSTAKQAALADLLRDLPLGEPIVVFGRFHADLDAIHRAAADAWGSSMSLELSGRTNDLALWQEPQGPPVLAVQVKAGNVGIDLSRASIGVWYTLPYSLSDFDQAQARLLRRGQTHSVLWVTLEATDTVDGAIAEALHQRREVIGSILDRLRR